jgi:galactose-1-phosphate uridylyltransferase
MEGYEALFKFAAKAGSMEGYLYEREKIEPLSNWVSNLETMYANLPDEVKAQIRDELGNVLARILQYGGARLEEEIRTRLHTFRSSL